MFRFSENYFRGEEPPKKPAVARTHKGYSADWNTCAGVESPAEVEASFSRHIASRYSHAPRWGRNI